MHAYRIPEIPPGVIKKVENYRRNWREHVGRMGEERSPRKIINYTPRNRRPRGRPRKRILDTSGSSEGTGEASPTQIGH